MAKEESQDWLGELYYIKLLLKRLGIVYLLFFLCRLLFYFYNSASFDGISTGELGYIFIAALRFDTSSILYANALVVLMHLLPFSFRSKPNYQKATQIIFLVCNALVLLLEIIDIGYFQYLFRRVLRSDIFFSQEHQNLFLQILIDYWGIALFYLSCIGLTFYLYKKTKQKKKELKQRILAQLFLFLLGITLTIVGMRGGFQLRPLMPIVASQYVSNMQYMPLVSNATLNLIHSFQQRTIKNRPYFDPKTLKSYFSVEKEYKSDSFKKKNVVILICESLSKEYIGYFNEGESNTPFLDSLLGEGMNFVNMYANGTRSTQGISAILAGQPELMLDPFIVSAYQANDLRGMGDILKEEGYETAFFMGTEKGVMNFDQFTKLVGMEKYYGRESYAEDNKYSMDKDYDGNWGIWDVPFYNYAIEKLNELEKPFFSTHFSLNIHHPFHVEQWFSDKYPGIEKRLVAIKYADYNLKMFFKNASKEAWFDNTVFVITADHTGPHRSKKYIHREGCYRIPLLIYSPADSSLKTIRKEVTQQIDIMPSLLGYMGYNEQFNAYGVNKFDSLNNQHYSYTFEKDLYQIIGGDYVLMFDGEKTVALFNRVTDTYLENNILKDNPAIAKKLEAQLKAVIQTYNHRIITNS